ncbi:MAG: hypothetical protein RLZZ352_2168 [Pseudomonadota bacterium]
MTCSIIFVMKYLVVAAFVAILGSLGAALFYMMRTGSEPSEHENDNASSKSQRMARALAFRVGFSVLLFVVVLLSYWMGWIQPTGLPR